MSNKIYVLNIYSGEKAQARVTPKQAIPFFFDKLNGFVFTKRRRTCRPNLAYSTFLFARDLAFFCLDFSASERASDLWRIFTKEIMALPDDDGFLFYHTFGKTLRVRTLTHLWLRSFVIFCFVLWPTWACTSTFVTSCS